MNATGPQARLLPDGRRLHLNHGPVDLIIEAFGARAEVEKAYGQAVVRFETILTELVAELPELRKPASSMPRVFAGPTARRMEAAVVPLAADFITPMAAVAGAVADDMLAALIAGRILEQAYVNDGGDIALFLAPGAQIRAAIAGTGHGLGDRLAICAADPVRGIATSGWPGRSFSLGIADAVTVLARTAAEADAAATIIANAVNLPGHPAVKREPAITLAPDTDLGDRLVTTGVGALTTTEIARALEAGSMVAEALMARGLIVAAALFLRGGIRVVGSNTLLAFAPPSVLPDISPTRGEIGRPPGRHDDRNVDGWGIRSPQPISPLVGEMSGRTEGGNVGQKRSRSPLEEDRAHA